jgi:hypothetical protein
MTPVRRAGHVRRLLLPLAIGLATVACQGSAATPSGNLVDVTPRPTVAPTPSVVPIATAISVEGSARPAVPEQITIDDPDLAMTLPVGWAAYPVATYRLIVDSVAKTSSPEIQAILEAHLKAIDDGAVRIAAGGPVGIGTPHGTLIIQVDAGDASLEAAVNRLGQFGTMFTNPSSVEERPMTLTIGKAVRRVETHPVAPDSGAGAVPARTVEYIARLTDGHTLWILATGPETATTFEALIDASVMTIDDR